MIDKMKGKIIIQRVAHQDDCIRILLDEDTYMGIIKDNMKIFNNRQGTITMMLLNLNTHPGGIFKEIEY